MNTKLSRTNRDLIKKGMAAIKRLTVFLCASLFIVLIIREFAESNIKVLDKQHDCKGQGCTVKLLVKNLSNEPLEMFIRISGSDEDWIGDGRVFNQVFSVLYKKQLLGSEMKEFQLNVETPHVPDRVIIRVTENPTANQ